MRVPSSPRRCRTWRGCRVPESTVFKAYPFSAEGSIKRNGGKFVHGPRDGSHVAVDGRLVTGMNWESYVGVADAMIRLLGGKK